MTNNMFQFHNETHLRGKIFDIVQKKYYTDFFVSCGNEGKEFHRVKRNGQFRRDTIIVRFFNSAAKDYPKQFKIGDKVTIIAVLQNVVDKHTQRGKHIEVWGLNMMPIGEGMTDLNSAQYRGKIESAQAISDKYVILNVKAKVTKKYKNTREDTKYPFIERQYISSTAVGVRIPTGDAKDLVYTKFTPGTWVDIDGEIQGRKNSKTGKHTQRFVANSVEIIGEVQKWDLRDKKL